MPDPHLLPRDLIQMLRADRRRVVPFIGAGLSVEAGVPAADPLARLPRRAALAEVVRDPPYGMKGLGEPPTVVSTAAILSALRDATGRELNRVPVRPDDIVGL